MDNVQLENGYTAIAHEILEHMAKIKLSPTQYRIIFVIWRYTYGFKRKTHELSLSFLSSATGCEKRHIQRELKELTDRKIIIQEVEDGKHRNITFNKHYLQWIGETDNGEMDIGSLDNGKMDNVQTSETTLSILPSPPLSKLPTKKTNIKTNIKTIYTAEFEKFYSEYPRPEDKHRSFTNWKTCLKTYTVEQLMQACRNYKKAKAGTEVQYLKSSANFLGKEKPFEDYINYKPRDNGQYPDLTDKY